MMRIGELPAKTFGRLKMNHTDVDYEPGEYRVRDISSPACLYFSEGGDERVNINVAEGESISVVMVFEDDKDLNIETNISCGKNSSLKLIQLDASAQGSRLFDRVYAEAGEDAFFRLIQLFPGRGDVYSESRVELKGDGSSMQADMAYLAPAGKRYDFNYVTDHIGRRTESDLKGAGVVTEGAFKIMRQTVDFKTGCSGAKGIESEKAILLGEELTNQSIPLILCSEEDVEGAHGAEIGGIDDEVLFYLASRGIDEAGAKRMMVRACLDRVAALIDHEETKERAAGLISEV